MVSEFGIIKTVLEVRPKVGQSSGKPYFNIKLLIDMKGINEELWLLTSFSDKALQNSVNQLVALGWLHQTADETFDNPEGAFALGESLEEKRLEACVQNQPYVDSQTGESKVSRKVSHIVGCIEGGFEKNEADKPAFSQVSAQIIEARKKAKAPVKAEEQKAEQDLSPAHNPNEDLPF